MSFSDISVYPSKLLLTSCIINRGIKPAPITFCHDCNLDCKNSTAFFEHLRLRHSRRIQCNSCRWQAINYNRFTEGYDDSFNIAMSEHLKRCTEEFSPNEPQEAQDVQFLYMIPSTLDECASVTVYPTPASISLPNQPLPIPSLTTASLPTSPIPIPLPTSALGPLPDLADPNPLPTSTLVPLPDLTDPVPLSSSVSTSKVVAPAPPSLPGAASLPDAMVPLSVEASSSSSSATSIQTPTPSSPSLSTQKRDTTENEFPAESRRKKLRSNKEY